MVDNYDSTMKEPVLLPTTFPNILVTPNMGIAVGMASNICSFNLAEICDGAIAILRNPKTTVDKLLDIIKAPDFSGGGYIVYDREQMRAIYETGQGSFRVRSRYHYDKSANCIEVLQIPYSTTIPTIESALTPLVKDGKIKEIVDFRDESDINGLKFTIDLRRGTDPDALMNRLYKLTPLEDSFKCNFNVLINSAPRQLGVLDILKEWILFRTECVRRELNFELKKKKDRLHLITGLSKVLLNIDEAVRIIRRAETDEQVISDLMTAFSLDEIQAEYIAEIKLRNLNRQYIINRVQEIEDLRKEIAEIEELLKDEVKIKQFIIKSLQEIKKTYAKPRKTDIVEKEQIAAPSKDIFFENYNCRLVMTRGGYFKKLSMQSARATEEHKLKEGDFVIYEEDTDNKGDVLFFTDKAQIYRVRVADFELCKASHMGDYVPTKLSMDDDEHVVYCKVIYELNPAHHMIYIFENGKGVRIPMSAYEAKSRRRKISGAYSSASPLAGAVYEGDKPVSVFIRSDADKGMLIKSSIIPEKSTRTSAGVQIMQLPKKKGKVEFVTDRIDTLGEDATKCRKTAIPSTGSSISQLTLKF